MEHNSLDVGMKDLPHACSSPAKRVVEFAKVALDPARVDLEVAAPLLIIEAIERSPEPFFFPLRVLLRACRMNETASGCLLLVPVVAPRWAPRHPRCGSSHAPPTVHAGSMHGLRWSDPLSG